jgi:ElaB/YqjD/DUF883 family membrane-anchored ribosome-binding protein
MANEEFAKPNKPGTSDRIERGAEHVKDSTSRAADRTHGAVDSAERGVHRGTDKVAQAAESTVEHSREAFDQVMGHAGDWADQAREYVREKPTQSLVMAIAAGWLIGRIMRH